MVNNVLKKRMIPISVYIIFTFAFFVLAGGWGLYHFLGEMIPALAPKHVIVAYVTSAEKKTSNLSHWKPKYDSIISADYSMPDPSLMTHINYAFADVNETFDGLKIQNPKKLMKVSQLKSLNPHLKVMLSVGGWESGRFSEMAADTVKREAFAADCAKAVVEYDLSGIDIDWEYPTSSSAGISSSPDDTKNFTHLMFAIRKAIGKEKSLTLATVASAAYIDFKAIDPVIDFVNIMAYDMGYPPKHHAPLFPSEISSWCSAEQAVTAHLKAGVPPKKLVLGMPFYGRMHGGAISYEAICKREDLKEVWHEKSSSPYRVNEKNEMVISYDNERSVRAKCQYVRDSNLLGVMYWEYDSDADSHPLARAVYEAMVSKGKNVR